MTSDGNAARPGPLTVGQFRAQFRAQQGSSTGEASPAICVGGKRLPQELCELGLMWWKVCGFWHHWTYLSHFARCHTCFQCQDGDIALAELDIDLNAPAQYCSPEEYLACSTEAELKQKPPPQLLSLGYATNKHHPFSWLSTKNPSKIVFLFTKTNIQTFQQLKKHTKWSAKIKAGIQPLHRRLGLEKYLTLWILLAVAVGIGVGQIPGVPWLQKPFKVLRKRGFKQEIFRERPTKNTWGFYLFF